MQEDVIRLSLPQSDKLSGVGFLHQVSVKETFPCHTHDFFELFYVTKGKAIHDVNGHKMVISQGTLVLIRPSDVHQYFFIDNFDMEMISIGVECSLMEAACNYLNIDVNGLIGSELPLHIFYTGGKHWNMVEELMLIAKKEKGNERKTYLMSILPDLLYQMQTNGENHEKILPTWLSKLIEEMSITENYVAGLPKMLSLAGVSQEHLTRAFKKYVELTPTAFINMKRISYSAELLVQGNDNILDICYSSGFNNVSYFYKIFEKTYHCTPKQFFIERKRKKSI